MMEMWFRKFVLKLTKTCCRSVLFDGFESSDSHRPTSSNSVMSRKTHSAGEEMVSITNGDLGSDATHPEEAQHLMEPDEKVRYATLHLLSPWFPESDPAHERAQTFRTWHSRRDVVMWTCSAIAVAILLVNFICTVYFHAKWGEEHDVNPVYQGSCFRTYKINTGLHALINILSTLLLGASNLCMQLLAAPTRSEIDKSHAKRKWLDIGVPSLRNLTHIRKSRLAIVLILGLSSVPLHFLSVA